MRGQPKRLSRISCEKWPWWELHFICFGFVSYRRCFLHSQPPFCVVGHFVCLFGFFFANKQEPSLPYYQILEVLKFENVVKFKICSLAFKLYNNPSTVPAIFHNFLTPTTTVHSYNTRNSTKLNFYRPQVRTNIGKFTFKYSASVMWEAVPLALKKANTINKFKKLYKAHLISCQSANICFV